jgi:uncharacterized protein YjiS (DUF1127 family)
MRLPVRSSPTRRNQQDRPMTTRSLPASHTDRIAASAGMPWLGRLRRCIQTIRSRRQLAELDDRLLSDIGISRAEALEEASRAPWDLAPRRR